MEFGKLPSIEGVDFSLPPEPPQNAPALQHLPLRAGAPRIYLGATGYNMKPWVGQWYPAGAKERDFLRFYGQQFNTIEHNTTHYRIPDAATVARWLEEAPADFRYCPKLPQTISHARNLGVQDPQMAIFCEAIAGLGDRLGCCFLQLPPHFAVQNLPALDRFMEKWPVALPLAVELRHPSFFEPSADAETCFNLLQEWGAATVITDVAGRRDVCHMRLTNKQVLIRFVGNNLHPTDYQRINAWSERLKKWFDAGLHAAYVFTHEPDNLLAPELAVYAGQAFSALMPDALLRTPHPVPPPAQQGSLF